MIRIRNLLSIKFFELYLYISLRNVSPQTLNSEVPFDPSGSPAFLQNNLARFAFSQLLCFPIFHRSFAATGWPEKLPLLKPLQMLGKFSAATFFLNTPRRFQPGTYLPNCFETVAFFGLFVNPMHFWYSAFKSFFLFSEPFFKRSTPPVSFNSFPCPVWWKGYLLKISLLFKRPFPGRKLIGWLLKKHSLETNPACTGKLTCLLGFPVSPLWQKLCPTYFRPLRSCCEDF